MKASLPLFREREGEGGRVHSPGLGYSFSAATERIEAFHLWRGTGFASAEEGTPPVPLLWIRGGEVDERVHFPGMRYSFRAATERIEAFHLWRGIGLASAEERTPPSPLLWIRGGEVDERVHSPGLRYSFSAATYSANFFLPREVIRHDV